VARAAATPVRTTSSLAAESDVAMTIVCWILGMTVPPYRTILRPAGAAP